MLVVSYDFIGKKTLRYRFRNDEKELKITSLKIGKSSLWITIYGPYKSLQTIDPLVQNRFWIFDVGFYGSFL